MSAADRTLRECLAREFAKPKQRRSDPQPERYPSMIIDEKGCVIQRGFLIPNRSRTSSSPTRTSQPATPNYQPIAAFGQPRGWRFNDLGMYDSVYNPSDPLYRPTKSADELEKMACHGDRPPQPERRQTWESGSLSSVWTTEELSDPAVPPPCLRTPAALPHYHFTPPDRTEHSSKSSQVHRSSGFKDNLTMHGDKEDQRKQDAMRQDSRMGAKCSKSFKERIKLAMQSEADDAIASDSEDDDVGTDSNSYLAHQPKRVSYAERRARQDERAAEQLQHCMAEREGQSPRHTPQMLRLIPTATDQSESAIESDDEEVDEDVANKLRMASIHTNRNVIATSQGAAEREEKGHIKQTRKLDEKRRASVNVKIMKKDGATPREIKSFESDSPMPCRNLRPSKSRPRPIKGVLKKTESHSSSSSASSNEFTKDVNLARQLSFATICRDAMTMPAACALAQIKAACKQP